MRWLRGGSPPARADVLQRRLQAIKDAIPLVTDLAVINSSLLMVKALVAEMRVVNVAISDFDAEIEALCETHSEFQIFASLPGSGTLHAARLLASECSIWIE